MRSIAKRSLISVAVFFLLYVGACFLWNSPSSPYQYGHYIPADLNDAHAQLMGLFPAKELDAIRASTSEDFMVNYHLGLGMGIRISSVGLSLLPCRGGNVRFSLWLGGLLYIGSIGSRLHSIL